MDKVTIADCTFLQYTKSFSIGGGNMGVGPTYFEWELADAQSARFVTDSFLKDAKGEGQVAILLESFFLHPENYITAIQKPFDYVLTSNQYFMENKSWLWYPHGGSWIAFDQWGTHKKDKEISILLSNKKIMIGHRMRHEIVERFGEKLAVFGLDSFCDNKLDALAHYKYSIVVEPERCPGLFSEHLIDCLSVGTIPIYWGCPNIGKYFDKNSFIEFQKVNEVDGILSEGLPEAYRQVPIVSNAIHDNLILANRYRIIEDWIYEKYPFLFRS